MIAIEPGVATFAPAVSAMSRSARAWAGFQGGRDPYITLISIYIFMPYVATVLVGDAVKGQGLIASYALLGGLIAALTAPFLGSAADRMGRRKPALAVLSLLFAPIVFALWWAKPGGAGISVPTILVMTLVISLLFTYGEVLHNSLITYAARNARDAATMSGTALAWGNVTSVAALVFVLWAFALPGKVHWSFELDPALGEPARVAAPIAAILFAIGVIPLLMFAQDAPRRASSIGASLAGGARDLLVLIRSVRHHRDAAIFLGARMLFSDAQIALILFCGIYAAGVMHWGVLQMTAFGILMSTCAALGGLLSSSLDRRLGPKRALQVEIVGTIFGIVALLGVSPTGMRYFFTVAADAAPLWSGPVFTKSPELVFLAIGGVVAVFNTAIFASSRTLLTRLIPPGQSGAFFGLFALSGTATVWLGPLAVQTAVSAFHSQQAGNVAIAILMGLGFIPLCLVRDSRA
jgi:UMF1 family MFS transporter